MARQPGGYGDYGTRAALYDKGRIENYPDWISEILKRRIRVMFDRQPERKARVLDVACGTGIGTRDLYEDEFTDVVGVDIDERMGAVANRRAGGPKYKVSSIADLDFPDKSFDMITTFGGLSWFHDDINALRNIQRMLGVCGIFVAIDEQNLEDNEIRETIERHIEGPMLWKANGCDPEGVFRAGKFRSVEFYAKEHTEGMEVWRAVDYCLAASLINLVPPAKIPALRRDFYSLCGKRAGGPQQLVYWNFRFSLAIGMKFMPPLFD